MIYFTINCCWRADCAVTNIAGPVEKVKLEEEKPKRKRVKIPRKIMPDRPKPLDLKPPKLPKCYPKCPSYDHYYYYYEKEPASLAKVILNLKS